MVSSPEDILRGRRQIAAASSTIAPPETHQLHIVIWDTVRDQVAIIPDLMVDVERLFVDGRWATESNPDTNVTVVIQAVVYQLVAKAFPSSGFHSAVERVVQNYLSEPCAANDVAADTINLSVFTLPDQTRKQRDCEALSQESRKKKLSRYVKQRNI